MEITEQLKKGRVFIGFILIGWLFFSCNGQHKPITAFFINDENGQETKQVVSNDVEHIKYNLYSYNGVLYLGVNMTKSVLVNNKITKEKEGVFLYDSIMGQSVTNIVAIDSYEPFPNNEMLFKDSRQIFYVANHLAIPSISLLPFKPEDVSILDRNNEYMGDGTKIYCLRDGKQVNTQFASTFSVIEIDGVTFGIDSTHIYSMCDPIKPMDFKLNFESVTQPVRDSIVKRYFNQ